MIPKVYLGGKTGNNDWRQHLVSGLLTQACLGRPIPASNFLYVGPLFLSCTYGCTYAPSMHGAVTKVGAEACGTEFDRSEVIGNNLASLDTADMVFAYITTTDCHETIQEMSWAAARGKCVVIAFAPNIDPEMFWFLEGQVVATYPGVSQCCLPHILQIEIARYQSSACMSRKAGGK